MLGKIKSLFCKTKVEACKPRLWGMDSIAGGGWGNSIKWFDWDKRQIVGWKPTRPRKGDFINAKLASGKIAYFEIIKVDLKSDPNDMFFADVKDFGYEDEIKLPEFFQESSQFRFV